VIPTSSDAPRVDTVGGRREPLNRHRVVRAAIAYIDTNGLGDLTMRRLAATLGVEAMSLYKHVSGRDHLLDAVVDALLDDLHGSPDVQPEAAVDWRDYLRRVAEGVRKIALDHPRCFPLVATRPPQAPWIRPPLRSLPWIDSFLRTLQEDDFGPRQSVDAYKAFTSFLLGHLLLEVAGRQVAIAPEDVPDRASGQIEHDDLRGYPAIRASSELLAEDSADSEFTSALESLLDRLAPLQEGHVISAPAAPAG
jgi:AcrR family transcriptional regulator